MISTILFQNIDRGTFSITDFYARRIRRIFPALGLVLFSVLIFGWFSLFPDELRQLGKHAAASAGFVQNFALWTESGYFDNSSDTKPLLHIWSLGIEEQFYFLWPLVLWAAGTIGKGSYKKFFYLLAMLSVFIISFALNLNLIKTDPTKTFYLPQYRFFEMALGGILSWVVLYKPKVLISFPDSQECFFPSWITERRIKNILSFAGLAILLIIFGQFSKATVFPGKNALLPIFATAFIIFAGPESWLNRNILSHKALVWFGLISYPLYLWHWPILSFGQIVYGKVPSPEYQFFAIALSIMLSWLTVKFIEQPFRHGNHRKAFKIAILCLFVFTVGGLGFFVYKSDGYLGREKIKVRKNVGDIIGLSDRWYRGKNDWLFLGNAYDRTVSKFKLTITPSASELNSVKEVFESIAKKSAKSGTRVALIIGPNKSSVYPEYLPDELKVTQKKYSTFFLEELSSIPNLTVYNPTNNFLSSKEKEGLLYWMTDTHWNYRGAFVAFAGFSKLLDLPVPRVRFQQGDNHGGDLIGISGLKDFPLHSEDSWNVIWESHPLLTEIEIPDEQKSTFGPTVIVTNQKSLSDKKVWVVGDSFTGALRPYINATFKEVHYLGHWGHKLSTLSEKIASTSEKPDIIIIVRVERSL